MNKSHIASAIVSAILSFFTISTAYAWPNDNPPPPTVSAGAGADSQSSAAAKAASDAAAKAAANAQQHQQTNVGVNAAGGTGTAETGPVSSATGPVSTSNTTTNSDSILQFNPVQVASLPPSIPLGNIRLDAISKCGPQAIVEPFKRSTRVSEFLGLWAAKQPMGTMHGILKGFKTGKESFTIVKAEIGEPFKRIIYKVMGSELYSVVEVVSQSGGASSAADYASQRLGAGAGASITSGTAFGVVSVVAMPCEYESEDNNPKVAETPPVVQAPDKRDEEMRLLIQQHEEDQERMRRMDCALHPNTATDCPTKTPGGKDPGQQ